MSQHDYDVANGSGAAVRADINSLAGAIASNNSGASAPSVTFAYMLWADTTTGIMKQRNAANTAWISLYTLSTGIPIIAGALTISYAATGAASQLIIQNTDGGANGPTAELFHDTSTPSNGDFPHYVTFTGRSSNATKRTLAAIQTRYDDTTNASEDATIQILRQKAGTLTVALYIGALASGTADANALGLPLGQLSFPATQSASSDANTFDDYEEGTATPSLGGTTTYTTRGWAYIKEGKWVNSYGQVVVNAIGTGSQHVVSGAPFTADNVTSGGYVAGSAGYASACATNVTFLTVMTTGNSSQFDCYGLTAAAANFSVINVFTNSSELRFMVPCHATA